jgi:sugar-specific transcriptional regulator TrmB
LLLTKSDSIRLLTQIGFTEIQAKLFLVLTDLGKTDAKTLSKQANVPRPATYRALGELQEKGIVERIISSPQQFKTIPLQQVYDVIIGEKAKEYTQTLERAKELILKLEAEKKKETTQRNYTISVLEGKTALINRTKAAHSNAQQSVFCCSTLERWLQLSYEIAETIADALARGVQYRSIIEANQNPSFSKETKKLMLHPNFKVRITQTPVQLNGALFDGKEASINFYPSKSIAESPMIWTDQPSLIIGFQDHFDKLWGNIESAQMTICQQRIETQISCALACP